MGIRLSERGEVFCVPYGVRNDEGTPGAAFVDLKAHPEWIPVLASCVGWPETRRLLETINGADSPLMSLAADQGFTSVEDPARPSVLTSFVTLCYAEVSANSKPALQQLAGQLAARLDERLRLASTAMQRSLHLDALIEVQPTIFSLPTRADDRSEIPPAPRWSGAGRTQGASDDRVAGWSLTLALAAQGQNEDESRQLWGIAVKALQDALG